MDDSSFEWQIHERARTLQTPNTHRPGKLFEWRISNQQLLPLERNANRLALISHGHSRGSLLRTDSARLGLVLDESNTLPARNQSDFLESFEPAKDRAETLLGGIVGQFPQEENLVRGQVLVWDDGGGGTGCWLQAGALCSLGWACRLGGSGGALEFLLGFEGFLGFLPFCGRGRMLA